MSACNLLRLHTLCYAVSGGAKTKLCCSRFIRYCLFVPGSLITLVTKMNMPNLIIKVKCKSNKKHKCEIMLLRRHRSE